jgi:hypothetical protein
MMDSSTKLSPAQIQALLEPFNYTLTEERDSDGQKLVPHEYVRARLSEIFGPLGWSEQTLELTEVGSSTERNGSMYVAYRARVRVIIRNNDGTPGAFWDGAGSWGTSRGARDPKSLAELHSDSMNGALSVAFLRATKNLGPQFGLSLYSQDRPVFNPRYYLPYESTYLPPEDGSGEQDGQQEMLVPDTGVPATVGDRPNDPT